MIVLIGGTGSLGRELASLLLADGRSLRIVTRDPQSAAAMKAAGAEVVRGDLRDRASLETACRGASTVIAAAHSILGRGAAASTRVDDEGHRTLIDVARRERIGHFVYTSVYDYGAASRTVPLFRIKAEVERYLERSGVPFTILRPTAFMETHAHRLIGLPVVRGEMVPLFGPGTNPRNLVAARDVARVAAIVAGDPASAGRTFDLGGPEELTALDVVGLYEAATGRTARVRHLPLAVARFAAPLIRPLHEGVAQVLRAALVAETTDQRFHGPSIHEQFGFDATPLRDLVPRWIQAIPGATP